MKTIKIILFISFILISSVFSQSKIDNKIKSGSDAIYNFNWEKGNKIFLEVIEEYPENPKGYHFKSIIPLWYYLGSYNEDHLDSFFYYSDKALDAADELVEKDSITADLANTLSLIYSSRSIAYARKENYVQAVWNGEQMKSFSNIAITLDPKMSDANLGLGLYNFAVSQMPSSLQWAIKLVGVEGNMEDGLQHLQNSISGGKLTKIDAQFYLSQIYSRNIIEYEIAIKILSELTRKYPKNLLFTLSLAWIELENGSIIQAEKKFKNIPKSEEPNFPLLKSLSHYQLGNINFFKNQFDSAIVNYKKFLTSKLRDDYVGISNYYIGVSFEMLEKTDSAKIYFKKSANGNLDFDEDSFAKRKGKQFRNQSILTSEKKIIQVENLIQSGSARQAIDSLNNFLKDSTNIDLFSYAYLLLAKSNIKLQKFKNVLSYSVKSIELETGDENWIHPFAHYYGALASYRLKNYLDAQLFLNLIDDYSDYDFALKLEGLRNSLQLKLNKITEKNKNGKAGF